MKRPEHAARFREDMGKEAQEERRGRSGRKKLVTGCVCMCMCIHIFVCLLGVECNLYKTLR